MNRCYLMFLMQYPLSWAFVAGLAGFTYVGVMQTVPAAWRDRPCSRSRLGSSASRRSAAPS
jgi:hypothetical protein